MFAYYHLLYLIFLSSARSVEHTQPSKCLHHLTYTSESISAFSDAETEGKSVQPVGKSTVYDVNSIFNHNIYLILLGN